MLVHGRVAQSIILPIIVFRVPFDLSWDNLLFRTMGYSVSMVDLEHYFCVDDYFMSIKPRIISVSQLLYLP